MAEEITDDSEEITDEKNVGAEFSTGFDDEKSTKKAKGNDDKELTKETEETSKISNPDEKETKDEKSSDSKDEKAEKDGEGETGKEATDKEKSGKETADTDKDKSEKSDKELTAQQKLEKHAADSAAKKLGISKEEEETEEGKKQPEKKVKKEAKETENVVSADISNVLDLPDLADAEIQSDGKKIKLKDFAAEYPEVTESTIQIARAIAKQSVEELMKSGQIVSSQGVENLTAEISDVKFWNAVQTVHPDGHKIAATDEFDTWLSKQSELVQVLGTSPDAKDGIMVLDAYKEFVAKSAKDKKNENAGEKKKARDALHKDTLRGGGAPETVKKENDKNDFNAGFNAD